MKKRLICNVLVICCICLLVMFFSEKSNAKTIKLEKGESYHIKLNSNSKIIRCKSKIIKVGKKGKITAGKKGKCVVKIKRRKQTVKYKFVVMNKKQPDNKDSESLPQPTDTPQPIDTQPTNTPDNNPPNYANKVTPGGIIMINKLSIESITLKTDDTSIVRLKVNEPQSVLGENIKYIETEVYNIKLEGFFVGDRVSTYINFNYDTLEKNGEVCRITGPDIMRSIKKVN